MQAASSEFKMDLASLPTRDYLDMLASEKPSPGGGSAAALCAATGAALVEMASRINSKRVKNENKEDSLRNAKKMPPIRKKLLDLMTLDAQAYEKLAEHWKNKSPQLDGLLAEACQVPLDIAGLSLQALEIGATEIPRTSPSLMSDLMEAGAILYNSFQSALLHVEVNLKAMKNESFILKTRRRVADATAQAEHFYEAFRQG